MAARPTSPPTAPGSGTAARGLPALPGTCFGRYRLTRRLGRGGMGAVWEASHVELKTVAAVKLVDPSFARNQEALERFRREARAAAMLRSTHVVQIFDYGVEDGVPYMAMERLYGVDLGKALAQQGKLSPQETARILAQVGQAIHRAHRASIVHRDLKPENVFLMRDGEMELVKVLDFGVAKVFPDGELTYAHPTATGVMLGTPAYASPEQFKSAQDIDHTTDTWALGVLAFRCITGRLPFEGKSVVELMRSICSGSSPAPSRVAPTIDGFDEWFQKSVAIHPRDRFQSVERQVSQLVAIVARHSGPIRAPLSEAPVALAAEPPKGQRSSFGHAALGSAIAVSLAGAVVALGQSSSSLSKLTQQDLSASAPAAPQPSARDSQRSKLELRVRVTPADARVSINGQRSGLGEAVHPMTKGARVLVEAQRPGYRPFSKIMALTVDKSLEIQLSRSANKPEASDQTTEDAAAEDAASVAKAPSARQASPSSDGTSRSLDSDNPFGIATPAADGSVGDARVQRH